MIQSGSVSHCRAYLDVKIWNFPALDSTTSNGGSFRLCWCLGLVVGADPSIYCQTFAEFNLDMGELIIVGVSPLKQDRTGVSGRACTIDSITGYGLNSSDRIWVRIHARTTYVVNSGTSVDQDSASLYLLCVTVLAVQTWGIAKNIREYEQT